MTSAISGRIIYKQSDRAYLDANIRSNSLVFDLTNNRLLYSPSGTTYYEFYPGPHSSGTSPVSGSVDWSNILNKPIASNSTSGVLTVSDWLTFHGKADTSTLNLLSATVNQLVLTSGSGGGVSAVTWNIIQNVPVASISTSGVLSITDYTKFNSKADVSAIPSVSAYALNSSLSNYYPISSTGNISGLTSPAQTQINTLSATVNQLVATSGSGISAVTWNIVQNVPVASISTSGVLSTADYNKFNSKADVSAIPSTSAYLTSSIFSQNSKLICLNNVNTNTLQLSVISASRLPSYMNGYHPKRYYVSASSISAFSANVIFYGANQSDLNWRNENNISATITNLDNIADDIFINNLDIWSMSLTITSGTIGGNGVYGYVEG